MSHALSAEAVADPTRGFVAFPMAVFEAGLRPGAFRLLAELCRMADREGWCWPTLRQLSERIGRSRPTLCADVGELRRAGLVETERQTLSNGCNARLRYRVTFWRRWRRSLSGGETRATSATRDAPAERRVRRAECKETRSIPNQESERVKLAEEWTSRAGRAPYPGFSVPPDADLLRRTTAITDGEACIADVDAMRTELRSFFQDLGVVDDGKAATAALGAGIAEPSEAVAALRDAWKPHWRRPPTEQQAANLFASCSSARSSAASSLLRSFLRRWERWAASTARRPVNV